MTAEDLLQLGVIDEIVPEPLGGAHQDPLIAARSLGEAIRRNLSELTNLSSYELIERRAAKYRKMGQFVENFSGPGSRRLRCRHKVFTKKS
ncbi:MAG: hypothetical protein KGR26_10135, partial [Cyanobacteria bacterium REEB65]|nr:hypothetical protein [Cyanobacteria bacterium REEB65]